MEVSTTNDLTKLRDRIERLEAEITCLKDDMTTKL